VCELKLININNFEIICKGCWFPCIFAKFSWY